MLLTCDSTVRMPSVSRSTPRSRRSAWLRIIWRCWQDGTFYGVPMTAGDIYTVAGTGTAGFNGDGGPAASAELFTPQGVAIDRAGNLLIGDFGNNRFRVVAGHTGMFYGQAMTAGHIYTLAGDGTGGFTGDGAPATGAELLAPEAVTVDSAGNLVIADAGNARVRVVAARTGTFYATAMTAGHIYTVAGNGHFGFSGDGGPATSPSSASRRGSGSTALGTRSSPTPPPRPRATSAATTGSGWPPPAPARSTPRR